ncbi:MAG: hypothetical protein ABIK86_03115 [candidate division WOR-3 bacterium]
MFFWEIIFGRAFLWEDILYQYYPFTFHLLRSLRSFTIPAWNPYMFGGMPFLADIQTQVFYPLNWFLVPFFTPDQGRVFWLVEIKCILHVFLGAASFYMLMRDQGVSVWSGLVAALTFAFSGFMVSHIIHMTIVSTFAWFPLILFFFLRVLRDGSVRAAASGAAVLGMANLAGHPQMSLHIVYTLLLMFVVFLAANWQRERDSIVRRHLPLVSMLIIGGFALSSAAYLPALRLSGHTVRELLTYAESAEVSLSPMAVLTLLVPKLFGSVTGGGTDSVRYWGGPMVHYYWETCLYLGIAPLLLALYGALVGKNRMRWPFVVLAVLAILLALGRHTPLYRLAFEALPGLDRFRIPARFVGVFGVAAAFLSGLGTEALTNPDHRRSKTPSRLWLLLLPLSLGIAFWVLVAAGAFSHLTPQLDVPEIRSSALRQTGIFIAILATATLLFWMALRRHKDNRSTGRLLAPLLVILTFADLYVFGHSFALGRVRPERFYPRSRLVSDLEARKAAGPFRVNARRDNQMLLQRNEGLLWQLELLEGYTPLRLADVAAFNVPLNRRNDLFNVKYRINLDSLQGRLEMIENSTALSRAWLADTCVVVADRQTALDLLSDSSFDYRRIPILEKDPVPLPTSSSDPAAIRDVRIINNAPHRMELETECSVSSLLVLSEVFYPEWQARVDGQRVEILRANYCFRCIALPPGRHNVTVYYDRGTILACGLLSFLSALGLGTIILLDRRPRPAVPGQTSQAGREL